MYATLTTLTELVLSAAVRSCKADDDCAPTGFHSSALRSSLKQLCLRLQETRLLAKGLSQEPAHDADDEIDIEVELDVDEFDFEQDAAVAEDVTDQLVADVAEPAEAPPDFVVTDETGADEYPGDSPEQNEPDSDADPESAV